MDLSNISKRLVWRVMRLVGMEKQSWDHQFADDYWSIYRQSPNTIKMVEALSNGGTIVEFGCGEGRLVMSLNIDAFENYIGIDISQVAVNRAAEKAQDHKRKENIRFFQSKMEEWKFNERADLILMEECINYVPQGALVHFLQYCKNNVKEHGNILIIMHSMKKHKRVIKVIKDNFSVLEENLNGDRIYIRI